ncbi:MAG: hypothetical protein ABSB82_18935 [Terriglobia bacterium]|jgi:hypothetical protein
MLNAWLFAVSVLVLAVAGCLFLDWLWTGEDPTFTGVSGDIGRAILTLFKWAAIAVVAVVAVCILHWAAALLLGPLLHRKD